MSPDFQLIRLLSAAVLYGRKEEEASCRGSGGPVKYAEIFLAANIPPNQVTEYHCLETKIMRPILQILY